MTDKDQPEDKKKPGKLYKTANFALSLDSWKKSFTNPFKRFGRYNRSAITKAREVWHAADDLEPAVDVADLRLAMKKSIQGAWIYGVFCVLMLGFVIALASNVYTMVTCTLIALLFAFRAIVSVFIYLKAKEELQSANRDRREP